MPATGLTDNTSLIRKASLSLQDLVNDGGYLVPEQAKRFIRVLIKKAVLLGLVKVEGMRSHTKKLSKVSFQGEVLKPGVSGQALASGDRSKPDLDEVELQAQLFKAEVRLNDEIIEDNIENGNFVNVVMQEMTKAVSRDMEKVVLNGDTTLTGLLGVLDGIRKQATSNVVAAGGVTLSKNVLRDMEKTLPTEFHEDPASMIYLTSTIAEIDYRDSVSVRETAGGDLALGATPANNMRDGRIAYNGIPVQRIPVMPENLGGGNDETEALFLNPENVNVGIWRQMKLETDKDITSGELIMVMTLRFDTKYEHEPAVVKATGIQVA